MVSRPRPTRSGLAALFACAAVAVAACDGGARTPDAQTQAAATSAELAIRFELTANQPATVSVLGFRAAAAGAAATPGADGLDVLGLVDPLSAAAPADGCILRDVDLATNTLGTRGGSIDLEELGGIGVGIGAAPQEPAIIRPFPRVYPDVAGVVAGVVAEAGPQPLGALPEQVSLFSPEGDLPVATLAVPALPRLLAINGSAPTPGARIDATGGLTLTLAAAAGAFVELRPFGATVAVSCAIPANASTESLVTIPRTLLAHLSPAVSIEIARRLRVRTPLAAVATRVSVETRSTLAVELRP
jgi:hypothetical protein